jgi:hypothetical protein
LIGNEALLPKSSLGVGVAVEPRVGEVSGLPPLKNRFRMSLTDGDGALEVVRLWTPPIGPGVPTGGIERVLFGDVGRAPAPIESERGRRTGETSRELLGDS